MFLPSLISAPIETALERDYFMTGRLLLLNSAAARLTGFILNLVRSPASPRLWYC
jgi:hypothetical protein